MIVAGGDLGEDWSSYYAPDGSTVFQTVWLATVVRVVVMDMAIDAGSNVFLCDFGSSSLGRAALLEVSPTARSC